MRILLVNSFYYPTFVGGAEISVQLLAEGLVNKGNNVYVLTTGPANKIYRVNGVVVISLKQRNFFSIVNGVTDVHPVFKVFWHLLDSCNFFYHSAISAIVNRIRPSVVHTNTIQGFSPAIWVAVKRHKIPVIHTMRDYYLLCHKCSMFNKGENCGTLCLPCKITYSLKKNFLTCPDHFVGISRYILDKHKGFFAINDSNSRVIYNAVEAGGSTMEKKTGDKLTFGYIGRIAEDKGVTYLVNELSRLNKQQQAKLTLIFAGKGEPEFIAAIQQQLGDVDYKFLGVVSPPEFYKMIDVLIVPALWNEPFGRTVIEALSNGVPVCQSDSGGLKEIYDPNSSWIFSPGVGRLSGIIAHLLENEGEVLGKKKYCLSRALQFPVESYVQHYLKLYGELDTRKKGRPKSNLISALVNVSK